MEGFVLEVAVVWQKHVHFSWKLQFLRNSIRYLVASYRASVTPLLSLTASQTMIEKVTLESTYFDGKVKGVGAP